jgi:hypothetical protein
VSLLPPPWLDTAFRLWRHRHWSYAAIAELLQAEGWEVHPLEVAAWVDERCGRELHGWMRRVVEGAP